MKRLSLMASLLTIGLCAGAMAAPPEDSRAPRRDRDRAARNTQDRAPLGRLDSVTRGATIRTSQVVGMDIQNEQGKSVGEINDLVLDANSGKIRYAAVTYGGFLGVGNKMFAVPWEAFTVRQDQGDTDDYHLVLNVTQQQLEGATGFDEDHWPDFADRNFARELDERYGVDRRARGARQNRGVEGVDVDVERRGVDVDVDAKPKRDN